MPTPSSSTEKVATLSEALPYIRQFSGSRLVIKYGGNAMTDDVLKASFAKDIALLKAVGMHPIVVHGGGPQINETLERMGKHGEFIQGMRVTDTETMQIVEMVLGGSVNKEIVSLLNQSGAKAIGITGKDCHFIQAKKMYLQGENQEKIDIGHVGEIEHIDIELIDMMIHQGLVPVIAPIGIGVNGETYNINADVVAGKLAETMKAEKLILLTNTPGVLDKEGKLISTLSSTETDALFANGTIHGGMIPKINSALEATRKGTKNVHIIDGRIIHALLLEIFTNEGVGTMIYS